MEYKLINKTGETRLCNKVTIDGFDYYVGDEIQLGANNVWVATKSRVFKFEINMAVVKSNMPRIVIATNNPNIDCPKVIGEVNEIKKNLYFYKQVMNPYETGGQSYTVYEKGFIEGYNKSQETHPFSEEDMIEFSEWCANSHYHYYFDGEKWSWGNSHKQHYCSTRELLQLWKEQKPKTIYL